MANGKRDIVLLPNLFGSGLVSSSYMKTPELDRLLHADIFTQHYYTVQQLRSFCQKEGLSSAGVKSELNERIEVYLRSGKKLAHKRQTIIGSFDSDSENGIRPDTPVLNYKTDQATRAFFNSQGVKFRASVFPYIREKKEANEKITYGDLVTLLKKEAADRKNPNHKTKILKSTEFNQFTRDYSEDTKWIKPHSLKQAWEYIKSIPGPKTYAHYKLSNL